MCACAVNRGRKLTGRIKCQDICSRYFVLGIFSVCSNVRSCKIITVGYINSDLVLQGLKAKITDILSSEMPSR